VIDRVKILYSLFTGSAICLAFLHSTITYALEKQDCNPSSINRNVEQLDQLDQEQIESLVQCGSPVVQPLIVALKSEQPALASKAALILNDMGSTAEEATQALVEIVSDENKVTDLRRFAAYALQSINSGDRQTIEALLGVFKQDSNIDVRSAVALALATNSRGDRDADVIETLINTLNQQDNETVKASAASALGDIAISYRETARLLMAKPLIQILQDPNQSDLIIAACLYPVDELRLIDKTTVSTLIQLLHRQDTLIHQRGATALANISDEIYNETTDLSQIDDRLTVLQEIQTAISSLDGVGNPDIRQAQINVDARIQGLQDKRQALLMQLAQQYIVGDRSFWIIHPLFWIALIFAYPKSSRVQAFFFWNKYIREIFGLWYVSALLTWVTPLRCRLFAPFKDSLLADAKLDGFDPQAFFSQSGVKLKDTDATQPIQQVFPEIKGQIILEGESGLGKTMMLRHLVRQSKRITVYLPAQKCENGVIEAIQAKLHGQAQDEDFLKKLIYSGAIDICIDGLNEVKPDVRANIKAFVESYFKGNIIMTTQPLLWNPPSTAKTYVLQPLHRNQIEQFLHLCERRLSSDAKLYGTDYRKACTQFLAHALSDQSDSDDSAATRRILSNPMDLTIVAQMIGSGVQPDLFRLQEQQYKLMTEDYERSWNQPFPLKQFSESVYQMRGKDEYALTGESFYQALTIMEKERHRMVLSRQWKDKDGNDKQEWSFRHDKIMEFFVVQNFMSSSSEGAEKRKNHMGDPRFRGIYLLLAQLLPLNDALKLREDLIQYAADTKDHTVSDAYVQLMRSRC
jgi:HEAT repeats